MVSKVRLVAVFYCIMPYPWGYHEEWKFIFKVMPQYDGNVARAYHECYEGGSQFPLPPSVSPISYRTLLRWWSNFEMHGETPTETAKREKLFLCRFKNKTFATGMCPESRSFLLTLATEQPQLYLDEFQLELAEHNWYVSTATISHALHEANWSLKLFSARARERNEFARYQFW